MKKILAGVLVVSALLFGAFYVSTSDTQSAQTATSHQMSITLGDTRITADIADTEALRAQGLSGRAQLDDAHGMLFVFQGEGYPTFWMKDMLISIDMLWLSADKRVVYIVPNASPESYPATFKPDAKAQFVLEVPAGWASRHAVAIGSQASF